MDKPSHTFTLRILIFKFLQDLHEFELPQNWRGDEFRKIRKSWKIEVLENVSFPGGALLINLFISLLIYDLWKIH